MNLITEFFTNFNYLKGLIISAILLIAIVGVLWLNWRHNKKMKEMYFD